MSVTDVTPIPTDQSNYVLALELLGLVCALICFLRVAGYTALQVRQHTLVDNPRSPQTFAVAPLAGALFAASVILLFFLGSILSYLLIMVGIGVFLAAAQRSADYQFGLGRVSVFNLVRWSLVICGAVFFVELPLSHLIDRLMTWLQVPHPEQQAVEMFRKIRSPSEIIGFILYSSLAVPLFEELFFRGFLYSFLKRFTSTWGAIILSAGIFAFAHQNLASVVPLWLLGIVLAVAYEHTGSLLLPMCIHGCFNLITAVSLLVEKSSS
jgi:membrane protease YdiL (CAAX protease family)